jgi:hypothetical protein
LLALDSSFVKPPLTLYQIVAKAGFTSANAAIMLSLNSLAVRFKRGILGQGLGCRRSNPAVPAVHRRSQEDRHGGQLTMKSLTSG